MDDNSCNFSHKAMQHKEQQLLIFSLRRLQVWNKSSVKLASNLDTIFYSVTTDDFDRTTWSTSDSSKAPWFTTVFLPNIHFPFAYSAKSDKFVKWQISCRKFCLNGFFFFFEMSQVSLAHRVKCSIFKWTYILFWVRILCSPCIILIPVYFATVFCVNCSHFHLLKFSWDISFAS